MKGTPTVRESEHLDATVRYLQQRFVFLKRRAFGLDVGLGAAAVGLVAAVVMPLAGWSIPHSAVYAAIFAGAGLVFGIWAWRVRVSALPVLQRADLVLGLQERLSTAYEYVHHNASHPFVPSLTAEAERVASQVDPRVVFPSRIPRRVWAIPVLLAALIGLSRLDIVPLQFNELAEEVVSEDVVREGKRLERWGHRLEELAKQQRLDRSLILARRMQNLGRQMQHESGEKSQAAQRISTLSQYLQRMQQELRERALLSEMGAMMAQDVLMSGKSLKQELHDILQLLRHDTLPREMTTVAEQGILRLSHHLGQNPDLQRLVQSLRAGNVKAARQLLEDIIQQQQAAEELEYLERARRALEYSSRSIQRDGDGDAPVSGRQRDGDSVVSNLPFDFDDEAMSEDMPGMEDFATPGFDQGFGSARNQRKDFSHLLSESQSAVSQVPVKSGEGAMRLAYIRYLPMQNKANEPVEQVVVRYQHVAEEVLSQEAIPRRYREQIKQYFLAIGMMPQDKR
ncbi:hypothetical protein NKDENANG_00691 [Candidatus Entotheonellaceae bacterium PAL068K]